MVAFLQTVCNEGSTGQLTAITFTIPALPLREYNISKCISCIMSSDIVLFLIVHAFNITYLFLLIIYSLVN